MSGLTNLTEFPPPALLPDTVRTGRPGAPRLLHIGIHNSANRNAGDTVLFPVVRRLFDQALGPCDWTLMQAWQPFEESDAERINREFDGVVIGGGGLLLRDQAGSDTARSGWQWNSSVDAVNALQVPVIVFAIGYNRFRGQDEFEPVFTDHITALANTSAFFGLRNSGSIRALGRYLPDPLTHHLRRQYCPTNVLWQLYPEYCELARKHDAGAHRVLAVNAAFDREEMRFGDRKDELLANFASAVRAAQDRGWNIVLAAHKTMDRQVETYLDAAGIDYETVDLTSADHEAVIAFYAETDFAVGMRGHAQMIPFGLRRPIMSIISHDKMRFLLEDIQRPDWGLEIGAPELAQKLDAALAAVEQDRAAVHAGVAAAQEAVWAETCANMDTIAPVLGRTS